jgi:hypothetical protein
MKFQKSTTKKLAGFLEWLKTQSNWEGNRHQTLPHCSVRSTLNSPKRWTKLFSTTIWIRMVQTLSLGDLYCQRSQKKRKSHNSAWSLSHHMITLSNLQVSALNPFQIRIKVSEHSKKLERSATMSSPKTSSTQHSPSRCVSMSSCKSRNLLLVRFLTTWKKHG